MRVKANKFLLAKPCGFYSTRAGLLEETRSARPGLLVRPTRQELVFRWCKADENKPIRKG